MISKVILDNPNIEVIKNANTEKENDIMITATIFSDLAERRRKDIEEQLKGPFGIAYTDGTERITQLNGPVENNLMSQLAGTYKPTLHNPIKVIFNNPATIVFWPDGTKTVVKCEGEAFDKEKGLAMAIAKRALGDKGSYYNVFKKWLPEEYYDDDYFYNQLFDDSFECDDFK